VFLTRCKKKFKFKFAVWFPPRLTLLSLVAVAAPHPATADAVVALPAVAVAEAVAADVAVATKQLLPLSELTLVKSL